MSYVPHPDGRVKPHDAVFFCPRAEGRLSLVLAASGSRGHGLGEEYPEFALQSEGRTTDGPESL